MFNKMTGLYVVLGVSLAASANAYDSSSNTADSTIKSFETLFGVHEGKRRNHIKGFCFEGTLSPSDKEINKYTSSALFNGDLKVIGRLSHKDNAMADDKAHQYGMGLSISTDSGKHLMSMNTLDFFPVATPEAFAELMHATTQGKPAVAAFKDKSKDLQRFKAHMAKKDKTLTPYEGSTYNSVNSFYLINAENKKTAVRWSFVPAVNQKIVLEPKKDFFLENMQQNLKTNGVMWNMVVTLANPDDKIDNAAYAWEGDNKKIIAATLKVNSISTEEKGQCDQINFDPLVLSSGFEPSADPLLQARRDVYAKTFGKRLSEKQK